LIFKCLSPFHRYIFSGTQVEEEEEGVTATMIKEIALELYHRAKETLAKPQTQRRKEGMIK
jgi:hypothetical protein